MIVDESYQGESLVFLVGCPRSGTTWLQRVLASHPRVRTGQESHLFDFYIGPQLHRWQEVLDPAVTGRGGVGIGCYITEEQFLRRVRRYMFSLLAPMLEPLARRELFLEKTPAHAFFVSEILRFLPAARFVHMIRDPRDVTASLLAASRSWGATWAPRTAEQAALTWRDHVQAARAGAASLNAAQFIEVRYEALSENPAAELERVAGFLGLEWQDSELSGAIEANRADQARRGGGTGIPLSGAFSNATGSVVEPAGFVRAGRPGAWRQELSWRQRLTVQRIAGRLMEPLGYASDLSLLDRAALGVQRASRWRPANVRQQVPVG